MDILHLLKLSRQSKLFLDRFIPVREEQRIAEQDGREVIRLIDPTEVPKGRSYFEVVYSLFIEPRSGLTFL